MPNDIPPDVRAYLDDVARRLSELQKPVRSLVEENRRLRLALALYEYAATVSGTPEGKEWPSATVTPSPKRGRKQKVSDDDIRLFIKWEPIVKARYASLGRRFHREAWITGVIREGRKPDHAATTKTIINRMILLKKKSRN